MKFAQRMDAVYFSQIREIFEEVVRRRNAGQEVISLVEGEPDFDTPVHIKEAAKKALDQGLTGYCSNYGIPELRRAITDKLQQENNIAYDPDSEVIVTIGVSEAIVLATLALLDPGDEVLIPTPCFNAYEYAVIFAGGVPVEVPLAEETGFQADMEEFRKRLGPKTKMMILATPNNPTGTVLGLETLTALAELAVENDLYVLSDEIYEKIIYGDQVHYSIGALPGMRARTVTFNGFSKAYAMTGWRIGYLAADAALVDALVRVHQYTVVCASTFAQHGGLAALTGPQDEMEAMVTEFKHRRDLVSARLPSMAPWTMVEPQGAFYAYLNVTPLKMTPKEVIYYLIDQAGVAGVAWDTDHIRFAYTNSYENIEKGMDRIEKAMAKL